MFWDNSLFEFNCSYKRKEKVNGSGSFWSNLASTQHSCAVNKEVALYLSVFQASLHLFSDEKLQALLLSDHIMSKTPSTKMSRITSAVTSAFFKALLSYLMLEQHLIQ